MDELQSRKKRFILDKKRRQWTHGVIPYMFDAQLRKCASTNCNREIKLLQKPAVMKYMFT